MVAIQAVLANTLKTQAAIQEESQAAKAELSDAKGTLLALREQINSMQEMQSQKAADADAQPINCKKRTPNSVKTLSKREIATQGFLSRSRS